MVRINNFSSQVASNYNFSKFVWSYSSIHKCFVYSRLANWIDSTDGWVELRKKLMKQWRSNQQHDWKHVSYLQLSRFGIRKIQGIANHVYRVKLWKSSIYFLLTNLFILGDSRRSWRKETTRRNLWSRIRRRQRRRRLRWPWTTSSTIEESKNVSQW